MFLFLSSFSFFTESSLLFLFLFLTSLLYSQIINFAIYREERIATFQHLSSESEQIAAKLVESEQRHEDLLAELEHLKFFFFLSFFPLSFFFFFFFFFFFLSPFFNISFLHKKMNKKKKKIRLQRAEAEPVIQSLSSDNRGLAEEIADLHSKESSLQKENTNLEQQIEEINHQNMKHEEDVNTLQQQVFFFSF